MSPSTICPKKVQLKTNHYSFYFPSSNLPCPKLSYLYLICCKVYLSELFWQFHSNSTYSLLLLVSEYFWTILFKISRMFQAISCPCRLLFPLIFILFSWETRLLLLFFDKFARQLPLGPNRLITLNFVIYHVY